MATPNIPVVADGAHLHRRVCGPIRLVRGPHCGGCHRGRHHHGERIDAGARRAGFWRVAVTSFTVILVAEFGDLTQVVTAGLAARYHDPVLVGVAAVLALWAVAVLAIAGGRGLLKVLPVAWITRAAALVMLVLATISAAAAIA